MSKAEIKRKTATSWQVKDRYNRQHYKKYSFSAPLELAAKFDAKISENGDKKATIFQQAMQDYIDKN